MCACAAHPRSGLAPMMPTRILLALPLVIAAHVIALRRRRSTSGDGLHAITLSNFVGQNLHGVGKACADLVADQSACLEPGGGMGNGEPAVENPPAQGRQDLT